MTIQDIKRARLTTGFSRKEVYDASIKTFSLPHNLRQCFERYYILHWNGEYLSQSLRANFGVLSRDKLSYLPIFQRCGPATLEASKQYKLSFRRAKSEYHIQGYVIIQPVTR